MTLNPDSLLSQRVHDIAEPATLKMAQAARDLRARGHDVISLSIGQPDFDTPQHIKDAAIEALQAGHTGYTPVPGLVELREAICAKFRRDNGLDFGVDNIVVSNGAKQSIANLCQALVDPGDEVILPAPYWASYVEIVRLAGGVPVPVATGIEHDFKLTPEQLESAINGRTTALLFSTPCNPTGSVYSDRELSELADVISRTERVCVLSDEIYEYINFSGRHASIARFDSVRERTATVNGFSKGFAMTGWRLGYMGAPVWLARACSKVQSNVTSGACNFNQQAAVQALLGDPGPTLAMRDVYHHRRDLVIGLLKGIPGLRVNEPQGTFYIFPDASSYVGKTDGNVTIGSIDELCEYILQEAFVAVVTGSAFGDDRCFRISFAASDDLLTEAIARISRVLSRLR